MSRLDATCPRVRHGQPPGELSSASWPATSMMPTVSSTPSGTNVPAKAAPSLASMAWLYLATSCSIATMSSTGNGIGPPRQGYTPPEPPRLGKWSAVNEIPARQPSLGDRVAELVSVPHVPGSRRSPRGAPFRHEEFDVVIVGSGAAAMAAAAGALGARASAVILEKGPIHGGTTATSGGVAHIYDNAVMRAAGIEDPRPTRSPTWPRSAIRAPTTPIPPPWDCSSTISRCSRRTTTGVRR